MEITKIQRLRGRRARYAIFIDGVRSLDVHESIVLDHRLCSGDDIDPPTIQRLEALDAELSAREIAINYLSFRPRSIREVIDHLHRKKIARPIAQQVATRLEQLRLLNDPEFARMFVRDRMRQKRYGQTVIRKQLMAKGIDAELIDRVFAELVSSADVEAVCLELARKRLERASTRLGRLEVPQRKQRLTEFLLRRGFEYDIVQHTIRIIFP